MAHRMAAGASSGVVAIRNSQQKSIAFSKSLSETAPRVLSLQRDFLRSVPWIKRAYGIRMPEQAPRARPERSPEPALSSCTTRFFFAASRSPLSGLTARSKCVRC